MFNIVITMIISLLFAGCGYKKDQIISVVSPDQVYEKSLDYTKSAQIINSLELKAKITATYLNPLYPKQYNSGEWFFIGVYFPGDFGKAKLEDLNRTDYRLELRIKDANLSVLDAKLVDKKSQLFKQMPQTDNWSRYYIVKFKELPAKIYNMNLTLISEDYGLAQMDFVK